MKRSGLKPSFFRLGERDSKRGVRHSATTKSRHMVYKRGRRKEKRSNACNYKPQGMDRRALGGMVIISLGHLGYCVISHFMQGLYEWLHVVLVRLDSKIVDQ